MKIGSTQSLGHLTYCTNVHAGVDWPDMIAGLRRWVPQVKAAVCADQSFGLGLRIAASTANSLINDSKLCELKKFLDETGCYVFTINGFPYGPFHGAPVKQNFYAPDWQTEARLNYTNDLADILAALLPTGVDGSISTVPGSFKAWSRGKEREIAKNIVRHVAHLIAVKSKTGRTIRLALEPEPCCMLETIDETIDFFENLLFSSDSVSFLARITGLDRGKAEAALRNLAGVCYDVCHAAVEYEDANLSIEQLRASGIKIVKLQLSSALRISCVSPETVLALAPFNEPVYLHQVIARHPGQVGSPLQRFVDLPEALAKVDEFKGYEWRVHFHVPVFIEQLTLFETTQFFLREILALHKAKPTSDHLEVETYTWDVLPEAYRSRDVATDISRELSWVLNELTAVGIE